MKVLYATTFSADLWATSGRHLVASYVATKTPHHLLAFTEGIDLPPTPAATGVRIDTDPVLAEFLAANADIIPASLGGRVAAPECRCPGGPLDPHHKKHQLPCVGYWFCKNASRWFRKVLAAKRAADWAEDYDVLMWVDSDAAFRQLIPPAVVGTWFKGGRACVYLKNRRTAIETGVVGYHLRNGGRMVIDNLLARYTTGAFRADQRWDDCVQLGQAIKLSKGAISVDLAANVGPNNTVIQFSPLGPYLGHEKGLHRRSKTMT